ncbi:Protein of unknown function, partial [Gryllus bimaculatus]
CLDREWRFHESTGAVGCNSPLGPHITSTLWNSRCWYSNDRRSYFGGGFQPF